MSATETYQYPKVYLYRRIVQAKLFIDAHYSEKIDLDNIYGKPAFDTYRPRCVHTTQFFEFAGGITQMSMVEDRVVLPDACIQPIASKDVAAFMASAALAAPANKTLEIGGPEKFEMTAWIKQYLQATHKNNKVVTDRLALYSGAPLETDTLVPKAAAYLGATTYADWITQAGNLR
ncbi:hypothetical protein [Niabella sp.]|uniref:hypothetical protein n=1 Tax=Niabella sp. TaxID=1962976 RepID=UPI0026230BCC|nr:hypothetical protein [Niabella sp.]